MLGFSMMYLVNERQWRVPSGIDDWFNYAGAAGMVIVPTLVALLGMRGKLPGVRRRIGGRGFEVDVGRKGEE